MLVKVRFLRNGEPAGRAYTYLTDLELQVGDRVLAGKSVAEVVELDVPKEEVAAFADRLKRIDVKFLDEGPEAWADGQEEPGKYTVKDRDLNPWIGPMFAGSIGGEDFFA